MLVTLLSPLTAHAQATAGGVDYGLPQSNAQALVILNNYYPTRYTWDHTDLTIASRPSPASPMGISRRSMLGSRPGPQCLRTASTA
jgi:hypothetical protein